MQGKMNLKKVENKKENEGERQGGKNDILRNAAQSRFLTYHSVKSFNLISLSYISHTQHLGI